MTRNLRSLVITYSDFWENTPDAVQNCMSLGDAMKIATDNMIEEMVKQKLKTDPDLREADIRAEAGKFMFQVRKVEWNI